MKNITSSQPVKHVWSVFCIVGAYGEKTERIATVCSQIVAYHIALKNQLEQNGQCYVAWTHTKETPDTRLRLLHKNIKPLDPIFFVKPQIWTKSTPIDHCPMCSVGVPDCLSELQLR